LYDNISLLLVMSALYCDRILLLARLHIV